MQGLPIGGSVHAGEITLDEGLTLVTDADAVVIHYLSPQATSQEVVAEVVEAAPAEGAPAED